MKVYQHHKSSRESPEVGSRGEDPKKSSGDQVERDLEEDALSPQKKSLNQQLSIDGRGSQKRLTLEALEKPNVESPALALVPVTGKVGGLVGMASLKQP